MKTYRILEHIYGEGTPYQINCFYPQVIDPHTLNNKLDPWTNMYDGEVRSMFFKKEDALGYIETKRAHDMPPREVIHEID